MCNSLSVAKALYDMYFVETKEEMDEAKMHKLMYLVQRESLLETNHVLFDESFYGRKYGPVLPSVHEEYQKAEKFRSVEELNSPDALRLLHNVLKRYGKRSTWDLSELSHGELSWKFSRLGRTADENEDGPLSVKLMQVDANRERATR
jgi:uncharacterized phage-associated protein